MQKIYEYITIFITSGIKTKMAKMLDDITTKIWARLFNKDNILRTRLRKTPLHNSLTKRSAVGP